MKITDCTVQDRKNYFEAQKCSIKVELILWSVLLFSCYCRSTDEDLFHFTAEVSAPVLCTLTSLFLIWKASPDSLETALAKMQARDIEFSVNGAKSGKLASYIKAMCHCHGHSLRDVEWLLSSVDKTQKTVALSIGQNLEIN